MMESIKVVIIVSIALGIIMGMERLCRIFAAKLKINRRILLSAGIVILLIVASVSGILLVYKNRFQG